MKIVNRGLSKGLVLADVKKGDVFTSEEQWPGAVFMGIWNDGKQHIRFTRLGPDVTGQGCGDTYTHRKDSMLAKELKIVIYKDATITLRKEDSK